MVGTLQNIANDAQGGTERPHSPTLSEHLRRFAGTPPSLIRVGTRKPRLDVLGYSGRHDQGVAQGAVTRAGFNRGLATIVEASAPL